MSADNARKLFVGGLADSLTETDLRAIFEAAGFQVEHLALPRDRESGRLRGFAFITLVTEEEANRARTELQGADCCGRPLSIREFSQESPKRGPGTERPPRQEEPTVFLGKLPFDATVQEIQDLFAAGGVGPVTKVILPLGPDGRPRGFGFASFANADDVEKAVRDMNGASLGGRQIVVSPAQPRGAAGAGPGGGRGEGGPPRSPSRAPSARFSDRPPSPGSYGGGGPPSGGRGPESYSGRSSEPPTFPPVEGRGSSRRRTEGKRKEREGRGGGEGASPAGARGARKRRGGGASWHQWESDDD